MICAPVEKDNPPAPTIVSEPSIVNVLDNVFPQGKANSPIPDDAIVVVPVPSCVPDSQINLVVTVISPVPSIVPEF